MARYCKSEIEESASETMERRKTASRISKSQFINEIGRKAWTAFSTQCVDGSNPVTGFYSSSINGKTCYFVEVGNIDRIFK